MSPILDDYVDVAERLRQFFERYPDGRLVTEDPWSMDYDGRAFICCHVKAYRTPDDPLPGDGLAWEPVPGPTPFTKDSELMNAQTSAWGRAIVALGFETKKIASAEEVRNRQGNGDTPPELVGEPDPIQVERGKLAVISKRLREQAPRPEGQPSWGEIMQAHSYQEFGKTDSTELSEGELRLFVEYANGLLKDEGLETV